MSGGGGPGESDTDTQSAQNVPATWIASASTGEPAPRYFFDKPQCRFPPNCLPSVQQPERMHTPY